jgi:hypothetical protein
MDQTTYILAAVAGLFLLFITARGELGQYIRLLV